MTNIYESPDKGETVFVRQSGELERTLHSQSTRHSDLYIKMKESQLWRDIHNAAKTNVPLADALDKVKFIYALIKEDKKTY